MGAIQGTERRKDQAPSTEGIRVLVVEDHRHVPAAIWEVLIPLGFSVTVAGNGTDTAKVALEGTYDVVIIGLDLPGASILEMCRKIAGGPDSPKVILVAAYYDDRVWKEARRAGAAHLVFGPPNPRGLAQAVQGAAVERRFGCRGILSSLSPEIHRMASRA